MIKIFDDFEQLQSWALEKQKRFTFIVDKGCYQCRRDYLDIKSDVVPFFPDWEFAQIEILDWLYTQKEHEVLHPDNNETEFFRLGLGASYPLDYIKNYIEGCVK